MNPCVTIRIFYTVYSIFFDRLLVFHMQLDLPPFGLYKSLKSTCFGRKKYWRLFEDMWWTFGRSMMGIGVISSSPYLLHEHNHSKLRRRLWADEINFAIQLNAKTKHSLYWILTRDKKQRNCNITEYSLQKHHMIIAINGMSQQSESMAWVLPSYFLISSSNYAAAFYTCLIYLRYIWQYKTSTNTKCVYVVSRHRHSSAYAQCHRIWLPVEGFCERTRYVCRFPHVLYILYPPLVPKGHKKSDS